MIAKPNNKTKVMVSAAADQWQGKTKLSTRLRATFEYVGPALDEVEAQSVWSIYDDK